MARLAAVKRRKKLLYEIGMAIVLLTVFVSALNFVTVSHKVTLITSKTIDMNNTDVLIAYLSVNTTSHAAAWHGVFIYKLGDIATRQGDALYISIPDDISPAAGYDKVVPLFVLIRLNNYTHSYFAGHGISALEYNVSFIGAEPLFSSDKLVYDVGIGEGDRHPIWWNKIAWKHYEQPYNSTEAAGKIEIDPTAYVMRITIDNIHTEEPVVGVWILSYKSGRPTFDGIVFSFKIYGLGKKPVLAIITEPLYAAFTAIASALYAAARRIRQYTLSAFGGLSLATLFSGLTGSATLAMILGLAFFVIMVELKKRPAR